ncbi:DUF4190 domain-containing protein [Bifidobacterium sp. 82T10]|uniref:DUF4190 domain-containing protein n=1 Tax=Bifidobacterium miconis TaxID=2834435 RepID=A0ABS6WFU4_9BIFI|nr:DUF4190 domain-containing protein [Bifidobacterium miconis]MBW3092885.1 DUF4190 domain-containing protein [Bifidobacterium miconis]
MSENNASPQTPYGNGTDSSDNNGSSNGYAQTPALSQSPQSFGQQPAYGAQSFGQQPGMSSHERQPYGPRQYSQSQNTQSQYGRQSFGQPAYGQAYSQTPQYGQQYGQSYGQSPQYEQSPYTQPAQGWYPAYDEPSYERWNILSIVGFVLAFPFPPVGLVLSIIALVQINRSREKGRGLAIAGTVVGAINTMLLTIVIVIAVIAFGQVMDYAVTNYDRDGYGYADDNGGYGDVTTDCAAELDGRCYAWDDLDDYMEDYLRKYGKRPDLENGNVGDHRASFGASGGDAIELIDVPAAAWTC